MTYYQIDRTGDAKIIGIKNGTSQVKLEEKGIEKNKNYIAFENWFSGYNKDFWNNQNAVFDLTPPLITGELRKGAKVTDIMRYGPVYQYLYKIYSKKFIDIIKAFNIGDYKTFEFNIQDINEIYYLFFLKSVVLDEINYEKSTVISGHAITDNIKYHDIKTPKEYIEFNSQFPTGGFEKLSIPKKYFGKDIIQTEVSSLPFYSERVVDFLLDCKITGLKIGYKNSIKLDFHEIA
ncbi:hypothetical protein D0817_12880 [Flavobacterium cupreum]|uniref:Uncharacterized protein n=1 Tax=Flavobacterium cupreum TaxID=2133766 RepID=A0A434A6P2_9FLAO|nr:hypothetical protein [Flavobacterium cupreum]RUT70071.1 hypothetical protein D0817_12880 [Flavobacterium cupreum]